MPQIARESLYDRLGGRTFVAALTDIFYVRVWGDPDLRSFFAGTDRHRLAERQTQFLVQVLGGPSAYDGRPLREAHEGLRVEERHFERWMTHLIATLRSMRADARLIQDVIARVESVRTEIVRPRATS
jgi:hemoglobin